MYSNSILRWALILVVCFTLSSCEMPQEVDTPVNAVSDRAVELQHNTAGMAELRIKCGSGFLKIRGSSAVKTLEVKGDITAYAANISEARRLRDEVVVRLHKSDRARPVLQVIEPQTQGPGQRYTADLTVTVPSHIKVVVFDDQGSLEVVDLSAGVDVTHGSGSVRISNVKGGVKLINAGATTTLDSISGYVEISDGQGRLEITGVTGNIDVAGGNGELILRHISGNVRAWDNPDGIEATNIDGDLRTYGIEHASAKIEAISGKMVHEKGARP